MVHRRQLCDAILNISAEDDPASMLASNQDHRSVLGTSMVQTAESTISLCENREGFPSRVDHGGCPLRLTKLSHQ